MDSSCLSILLAISMVTPTIVAASDVNNQELMDSCAQKTIVTGYDENQKIVQVGESIDGFCSGYLKATFSAFVASTGCDPKNTDVNFLLSVYEKYTEDKKPIPTAGAFETLMKAFTRIANCNAPKQQKTQDNRKGS